MDYAEKKEFLENAKTLAMDLEEKTNEIIEIQIGWIDDMQTNGMEMPLTICLNKETWFGSFEKIGWNEYVIWDNINKFIPVKNPYLALNKLIERVYEH